MTIPPEVESQASGNTPPTIPNTQFTVSETVVELLRQTKPWVRFLLILGFIGAGLMALMGVVALIGGAVTQQFGIVGFGLLYAVLAVVYIFPSMLLFKYANRIGDLLRTGSERDLEGALERQKAFWKFVGIMAIVMLCLYPIIIVFAIMVGAFASM